MDRTEFYLKLRPYFSYDEIRDLESYAVIHYGAAPGCRFTGYNAVFRLLCQNLASLGAFNDAFALIIRRSYTRPEYERLCSGLMREQSLLHHQTASHMP